MLFYKVKSFKRIKTFSDDCKKLKTNANAKLWRDNKEYYGIFNKAYGRKRFGFF